MLVVASFIEAGGLGIDAVDGVQAGAGVALVAGAVELVGAGFGDEIDDGAAGSAVLGGGVVGDDGLVLEDVGDLRGERLTADADVVDLLAVQKEVIGAGTGAVDLDIDALAEGAVLAYGLYARNGQGEFNRIEREDGELLKAKPAWEAEML